MLRIPRNFFVAMNQHKYFFCYFYIYLETNKPHALLSPIYFIQLIENDWWNCSVFHGEKNSRESFSSLTNTTAWIEKNSPSSISNLTHAIICHQWKVMIRCWKLGKFDEYLSNWWWFWTSDFLLNRWTFSTYMIFNFYYYHIFFGSNYENP